MVLLKLDPLIEVFVFHLKTNGNCLPSVMYYDVDTSISRKTLSIAKLETIPLNVPSMTVAGQRLLITNDYP
jgi:hypothetical protein